MMFFSGRQWQRVLLSAIHWGEWCDNFDSHRQLCEYHYLKIEISSLLTENKILRLRLPVHMLCPSIDRNQLTSKSNDVNHFWIDLHSGTLSVQLSSSTADQVARYYLIRRLDNKVKLAKIHIAKYQSECKSCKWQFKFPFTFPVTWFFKIGCAWKSMK